MKKIWCSILLLLTAGTAHATHETFTSAGALNCSAITHCTQSTTDKLFALEFVPTYPTSAPSPKGFEVRQQSVEVYNGNGGALDLNIMQVALTGSEFYNGMNFLGAIQLETLDAAGNWRYRTQWSSYVASTSCTSAWSGPMGTGRAVAEADR